MPAESDLILRTCESVVDFDLAIDLTRAYVQWLGIDLAFQDIDTELAGFAEHYREPQGLFLLAFQQGRIAGGVGLRGFAPGVCEMKRLYVYPAFQRLGIGRRLCADIIAAARQRDYRRMRLDTLGRLDAALNLYRSFGFQEIEAYRYNPVADVHYLELLL